VAAVKGLRPSAIDPITPAAAQAPAANTPAVATLAADPAAGWTVAGVRWSYDGVPAAGSITVASGGVTETYYVTAAGPGFLPFDPPLLFPANQAVTVTLAAGGSGVKGTVYPTAWKG
jgi:hypothetical protein